MTYSYTRSTSFTIVHARQLSSKVAAVEVLGFGGEVEIDHVGKTNDGYLMVVAEAFDDSIDDLRARGFKVEILPDFPGVIR